MTTHRLAGSGLITIGMFAALLPTVGVGAAGAAVAEGPPRGAPEGGSEVDYHEWSSQRDFASGRYAGTATDGSGDLTFDRPAGRTRYRDPHGTGTKTWEYASWVSPEHRTGLDASEVIASWTADTPRGSWLRVDMRGRTDEGKRTKWYAMGRWAAGDADIRRTSVPDQADANGTIEVDRFVADDDRRLRTVQLRVTLYRSPGSDTEPTVRSVGAMASLVPNRKRVPTSPGGGAWGKELDVPRYAQSIHRGHFPRYGGGGAAWCGPAVTSMVMAHWDQGPGEKDYRWVGSGHQDPWVDHAARGTFDWDYDGTGNWAFNTAYAGRFGLDAFVTRLRSLTELEKFISAGIPVVTSQAFERAELPGAGYDTNGHLMVVVGFTEDGDVIANDPAAPDNGKVRRVYPRESFENVWQRTSRDGATGGVAYVIAPPDRELPTTLPGVRDNW